MSRFGRRRELSPEKLTQKLDDTRFDLSGSEEYIDKLIDKKCDLEKDNKILKMRNEALELSLGKALEKVKTYEKYIESIAWNTKDQGGMIEQKLRYLKNPEKEQDPDKREGFHVRKGCGF